MRRTLSLAVALTIAGCGTPSPSPEADERASSARGGGSRARAETPWVGVKIYEPVPDPDALLEVWKRLGIDTVFLSTRLAEEGLLIPAARREGLRSLVITPVFYNPEYLTSHPDAWAITGRGERARDDWVEFVCPSREEYRETRRREVLALLAKHRPDGLSLDFIRHFVFWEMVKPDGRIDPLDTTCFCPRCLARFREETGVQLPAEVTTSAPAAAKWILAKNPEDWVHWRAGLITSWVREVVEQARTIAPEVTVGIHLVPWGSEEYDGALVRVAGQNVEELASYVDYLSPMCYAHMLDREPDWVGEVVEGLAARANLPIYPSIEVEESYRSEELSEAFFTRALRAALRPPSSGVILWSWPPLAESESKQEILARRGR